MFKQVFNLDRVLDAGSIVASRPELGLLVTVNDAQITVWHCSSGEFVPYSVAPAPVKDGYLITERDLGYIEELCDLMLTRIASDFYKEA